jgi:acyl-CoA thioester hydrolase
MYYGNYLKHFEEGRYEYMLDRGVDLNKVAEEGTLFTIRKVEIEYKASAACGDLIRICSEITNIKKASLVFKQEMFKEDRLLASASVDVVCVNKDFKPQPIPEEIQYSIRP